MTKCDLQ